VLDDIRLTERPSHWERGKLPAEADIAFGLTTIVKPFEPRIFTCQRAPVAFTTSRQVRVYQPFSVPAGQLKLGRITQSHSLASSGGGEVYRRFFRCQVFCRDFFRRGQPLHSRRPVHLSASSSLSTSLPAAREGKYIGGGFKCKGQVKNCRRFSHFYPFNSMSNNMIRKYLLTDAMQPQPAEGNRARKLLHGEVRCDKLFAKERVDGAAS